MQNKLSIVVHLTGLLGVILLVINLIGLFIPLRAPVIGEDYADFARPNTLPYQQAMQQLENLGGAADKSMLTEATRIFHYGMAHIPPEDIKRDGLDLYRMRVPVWENYLLYLLSYIKPDTYLDYEFCSYRKALQRGTGRCGQQSLALVGYLAERGLETGFVHLGGHTVATAKTDAGQWLMLDPDFGGVIPHELSELEKAPNKVLDYYWNDELKKREGQLLFGSEGNYIDYGGPNVRWKRVCPIEYATYLLKWLLPASMVFFWLVGLFMMRKITAKTKTT